MSTPAAKRRRVDTAAQTLSKPFRSPFKTPLKQSSADKEASLAQVKTHTAKITSTEDGSDQQKKTSSLPSQPVKTPIRAKPSKTFSSPISTAALNADPDIALLAKRQRDLEREVRELKEELDTIEQAKKIEAESEKRDPGGEVDGELVELIHKWKVASRQAAEEVFGTVRDRVNRMGGPRAWKEMQKRQREFQRGFDEEPPKQDSDDEVDQAHDGEKRDLYAEYDVDVETANEKEQCRGEDNGEDEGQEDEFTMSMMLRSLNVDLNIIGYDRDQQRWGD